MLENAADSPASSAPPHDESHHVSPKKQGRNGSILQCGRRKSSPSGKAMESGAYTRQLPWCTVVSDQDDVSTGGARKLTTKRTDPDYA